MKGLKKTAVENVSEEKSRFYQNQNQIEFPSNRQTKGTTQKNGTPTTVNLK
jgi:hypothetical protein